MTSFKRLMGLCLMLLSKSGLTFLQRTTPAYRLSCARMNSIPTQNNTTILPVAIGKSDVISLEEVNRGTTTVRFDLGISNSATSANVVRSSYRNSGSDVPLTVSSSIGSHSYRENRPSSEQTGKFDRDRDRTSSNSLRSSKDRPSGSSSPYRGRGSSRPSGGGAGPDVIFSSGFENNRNSRGAKESFENSNTRDYRDSNNNQKAFSKPWKNRRPFDPAVVGIESTQDYPSSSYRTVVYDHLATTSLEGIEALPHIRFSKGRTYLTRWWNAAKKWNLLCDELLEMDQLFLSKSAATSQKENAENRQADFNPPEPRFPLKQEENTPIQDERNRISAVLSQLVDGYSVSSTLEDGAINRNVGGKCGNLNTNSDPKLSGTFSADPGTSAESVAENKINQLITETIKSVRSLETDSWESSGSSHPLSKEPESWETDGPLGPGTGLERAEAVESESGPSSISEDEDVFSVTSTGKKRDSESEWQPNKVDDNDDNYKGNNGNDRQWTQEGARPYTENDVSVPIDQLYAMCSKQKARVICIGDVHGCIDELKDLLREVKYMPGDLVLLLGDLVAKGPSSAEVVRLAMDIGALSVRGNHDHEVVRQGLKYRQRGSDGYDRDREQRDRELRDKDKERDREKDKDYKEATERVNGLGGSGTYSSKARPGNWTSAVPGTAGIPGPVPGSVPGPGTAPGLGPDSAGGKSISTRVQQHLELGMQLTVKELAWLAELPFYIRSVDLGCVFVHAGFKAGKKLNEQDPWVMMTVRSLLPDGRMSPRCFNRHPWANKWKGPLTAYFGHDAARGLQVYDCAVGLDTGCVYGGHLSAVLLPEKKFVQVPARKAYQPYGKSRSHKMYAWSNDNETEADSSNAEPELYEFSSSLKSNITDETKLKNSSQNTDLRDYPLKVANVYQSSKESSYFESSTEELPINLIQYENEGNSMEPPISASDPLQLPTVSEESPAARVYEVQDTLSSEQPSTVDIDTAVIPLIDALALSDPALDPSIPILPSAPTSVFSNSSLAKEIAAALAAPNPNGPQGVKALSDSFDQMDSLSLQLDSLVPNDPTRLGGQLLDNMSSRLSGPRILQKRGELDGLGDNGEEISPPVEGVLSPSVAASSPVLMEYQPYGPYPISPSSPLSDTSSLLQSSDVMSTANVDVTSTSNEFLSNISTYDEEAESAGERALNEFFARADNSRYPRGSEEFFLEEMRRKDETSGDTALNDEARKRLQLNALSDNKSPFNIYNPYLSIDQLLAEFLATADVCDPQMTNIVKKGLHEVLLMEFGSESLVLESLRLLLAREDYLRLDVGRALHALSYDLAKMETIKKGSCEAYVSAVCLAGRMSENKLIDLIRLHGSESDLPEFNMKRKPSKEEYVAIIFKLLASKFDNDIEAVSKYLELETLAPIKKGFGVRGTGFGASAPKKSPPND